MLTRLEKTALIATILGVPLAVIALYPGWAEYVGIKWPWRAAVEEQVPITLPAAKPGVVQADTTTPDNPPSQAEVDKYNAPFIRGLEFDRRVNEINDLNHQAHEITEEKIQASDAIKRTKGTPSLDDKRAELDLEKKALGLLMDAKLKIDLAIVDFGEAKPQRILAILKENINKAIDAHNDVIALDEQWVANLERGQKLDQDLVEASQRIEKAKERLRQLENGTPN